MQGELGENRTHLELTTTSPPDQDATLGATRADVGQGPDATPVVSADRDGSGVEPVLDRFVDAFNALDLERFRALWAEDAAAFFPMPHLPHRRSGAELWEAWRSVFDGIRSTNPGPPYLDLRPADIEVVELGPGARLVTFHLALPGALGRRSLVLLRRPGDDWKVVHLHGSNLAAT